MRYVYIKKNTANHAAYVEEASFLPNLVVDDIPLEETGVLTQEGYMICRAPVMGFHTDHRVSPRGSSI